MPISFPHLNDSHLSFFPRLFLWLLWFPHHLQLLSYPYLGLLSPFHWPAVLPGLFCEQGRERKKEHQISCASFPLSLLPLQRPRFVPLLLCPLVFHRSESLLLARSQPSQAQSLATTGEGWAPPLCWQNTWTSHILLTCARSIARAGRLKKCNSLAFS